MGDTINLFSIELDSRLALEATAAKAFARRALPAFVFAAVSQDNGKAKVMLFQLRTVSKSGAPAGCILVGTAPNNKGLRIKSFQAQIPGQEGPIQGRFQILDSGNNKHVDSLGQLVGQITDAEKVLGTIRQFYPSCVNVVNTNILVIEEAQS
jgi:hypothetical protein